MRTWARWSPTVRGPSDYGRSARCWPAVFLDAAGSGRSHFVMNAAVYRPPQHAHGQRLCRGAADDGDEWIRRIPGVSMKEGR